MSVFPFINYGDCFINISLPNCISSVEELIKKTVTAIVVVVCKVIYF